ncbi:MAG: methyltransferase, partial [Planctomycetaceae bacterium]
AFVRALSMISTPGWLAFNIKESFLKQDDHTGFCGLIQRLCRDEYIQTQCYRRYCHRMSMAGEPLYYVAMICKKLRDCPADYA